MGVLNVASEIHVGQGHGRSRLSSVYFWQEKISTPKKGVAFGLSLKIGEPLTHVHLTDLATV